MKFFFLPILLLLSMAPTAPAADPIDKVVELIKQANTAGLADFFAPSIEMTVEGQENMYSKVQAGLILDKFFNQNKPKAVKIIHRVNSNASYQFAVILLHTDKGVFRITYTLKESNSLMQLIELRIEAEKAK